MKKRIVSLALAALLTIAAPFSAGAAGYASEANKMTGTNGEQQANPDNFSKTQDVVIKANIDQVSRVHVYGVAISATELTFTMDKSGTIWNPDTLAYEDQTSTTYSWRATSQDITITNYSDLVISVTGTVSEDVADDDVTLKLMQDASETVLDGTAITTTMASAIDTDTTNNFTATAKTQTWSVEVDGKHTETKTRTGIALGKIHFVIAKQ